MTRFVTDPSLGHYRPLIGALMTHPERMSLAHWACSLLERAPEVNGAAAAQKEGIPPPHSRETLLKLLYADILDLAGYQNLSTHKRREWGLESLTVDTPEAMSSDFMDRRALAGRISRQINLGETSPAWIAAFHQIAPEEAQRFEASRMEPESPCETQECSRDHWIDLDRDEYRTPASPHLQLGIPLEWRALALIHLLTDILPTVPRSLVIDLLWNENTRRTHLEMRMQKLLERLQKKHGLEIRSVSQRTRGAPAPCIELSAETRSRVKVRTYGKQELPSLLQTGKKIRTSDISETYGLSRSHAKRLYNAFIDRGWIEKRPEG